jgi:hypothetical protein
MTVYADYMDLRKAVMDLVKSPSIIESLDRHTRAGELWISRTLRHRKQETAATLTFVDGRATLPADFVAPVHVYTSSKGTMDQGGLDIVNQPGSQFRWYAVDDDEMVIYGHNGPVDIVYLASIPTITGSMTGTNWLLLRYPDLYLLATAYEAVKAIGDVEKVAVGQANRQMGQAFADAVNYQAGIFQGGAGQA